MKEYEYLHVRIVESDITDDLNFYEENGWEFITIFEPVTNCFDLIMRRKYENNNEN